MLFLVEGIITVGLGIISFFTLTDRIETARWLSEDEKGIAIARMQADMPQMQSEVIDKLHIRRVLGGIFNVTSITMAICFLLDNISVQGMAFFLPTIIRTLYPDTTLIRQQLLTVPPYLVGAIFGVLIPYLSMKFRHRGLLLIFSGCLMITGYSIYVGTEVTDSHVRYAGSFLIAMGAFSAGPFMPGWASANQNTDSGRAGAIGIVVMLGNAGGLVACWSYLTKDAPDYLPGNALNVAAACAIVILVGLLTLYLKRENVKRDRKAIENGTIERQRDTIEEPLDHRHTAFRYRY